MTPFLCMLLLQTMHLPSSAVTDYWVTQQEKQMIAVIQAMPAVKYSFAPTNGEFRHVRTFGEQAKDAVPALQAALNDPASEVRKAAGVALGYIDPSRFPAPARTRPARG